ncbi:MAG: helix-turn-helix domain-containing protein [Gammaproteobacteria bacterium]
MLLRYADGISISDIQRQVGVSRPTIYKCIDKALSAGVQVLKRGPRHVPRRSKLIELHLVRYVDRTGFSFEDPLTGAWLRPDASPRRFSVRSSVSR